MLQKLHVNNFNWVADICQSQFTKYFIENCSKESDKGYFLEVGVKYLENLHNLHNDLLFLEPKLEPNHHTTNFFSKNLSAIETKKTHTHILMNKPVYLGL